MIQNGSTMWQQLRTNNTTLFIRSNITLKYRDGVTLVTPSLFLQGCQLYFKQAQ